MRLPRLHVLRSLAALAIAIASPGVEVSHGLAHEHDHDAEHGQAASHHGDASVEIGDHGPAHGHPEVSEALRNRAGLSDFLSVEAAVPVIDLATASTWVAVPVFDSTLTGDRATGPPPSLRAPPID